jgi:hypothetical protein
MTTLSQMSQIQHLHDQIFKIKNEGIVCVPRQIEQCEGGEGREHRRQTLHSLLSQPYEYVKQYFHIIIFTIQKSYRLTWQKPPAKRSCATNPMCLL